MIPSLFKQPFSGHLDSACIAAILNNANPIFRWRWVEGVIRALCTFIHLFFEGRIRERSLRRAAASKEAEALAKQRSKNRKRNRSRFEKKRSRPEGAGQWGRTKWSQNFFDGMMTIHHQNWKIKTSSNACQSSEFVCVFFSFLKKS